MHSRIQARTISARRQQTDGSATFINGSGTFFDPPELIKGLTGTVISFLRREDTVKEMPWRDRRNSRHTLPETFHATLLLRDPLAKDARGNSSGILARVCVPFSFLSIRKILYVMLHPAKVPRESLQRVTGGLRGVEKYSHVNEWRELRRFE